MALMIVICIVHSISSSNEKLSFVHRRPFMNSRIPSSRLSKTLGSTLAILGAITWTEQFNSCATLFEGFARTIAPKRTHALNKSEGYIEGKSNVIFLNQKG